MSPTVRNFVLPFGKSWKGKTLGEIGSTDDGLRFLDWAIGQNWISSWPDARRAIQAYLDDPSVQTRVDALLDD